MTDLKSVQRPISSLPMASKLGGEADILNPRCQAANGYVGTIVASSS